MRIKILFLLTVIIFSGQILFSVYYSLKIVDENSKVNTLQDEYNKLMIVNQNLENSLNDSDSIRNLLKITQNKPFPAITKTIDLNQ
jgi:hypothetical protein